MAKNQDILEGKIGQKILDELEEFPSKVKEGREGATFLTISNKKDKKGLTVQVTLGEEKDTTYQDGELVQSLFTVNIASIEYSRKDEVYAILEDYGLDKNDVFQESPNYVTLEYETDLEGIATLSTHIMEEFHDDLEVSFDTN